MNKSLQSLFLILLPFYALIAWAYHFVTDKPLDMAVNILLLPVAGYFLVQGKVRVPKYLVCFIIFTIYHLASTLFFKTMPEGENPIYSVLADINLFACTLLIIIENMTFSEEFIHKMYRNLFIVVVLTLIVSVIQIKFPTFMFNEKLLEGEELDFWGEEIRNNAFYSYVNTNSLGISFPIFVAILLNYYDTQKKYFALIILSGIVVAFLTKTRYVMLSTIIAFSQLFFAQKRSMSKRLSLVLTFAVSIVIIVFIANEAGFNIDEVIANRILEKGNDMESAKARVTSYEVFMIKFPEHPWLGVGPKTRPDVVALLNGEAPLIHVGYLSYLYFYGVVGCFFIFLSFFFLLKDAWSVGKRYNFWGSFYGFVSFLVANVTFVYFNMAEMGMIIAVLYLRFYNQPEELVVEEEEHTPQLVTGK